MHSRLFSVVGFVSKTIVRGNYSRTPAVLSLGKIPFRKSSTESDAFCEAPVRTSLEEIKDADYSELETDPETCKQLKVILIEQSMARETGQRAPSFISVKDMKELLSMRSYSARRKYMNYLFLKECAIANDKVKKEKKATERLERLKQRNIEAGDHIRYGLAFNSLFQMIRPKSIARFYTSRLLAAAELGQPIVFDMSLDQYMNREEKTYASTQLKESYTHNKHHREPFNLHFVSADPSNGTMEKTLGQIPNLYQASSMINISEKSYLDIFPKEKLVYLTPNAPNMLETFDPEAVYIIGALVDKRNTLPLTMAKAKKERIKMAKLPLDKYVVWGCGHKSLTLNQVLAIMLDIRVENDWHKVLLRHLPMRKLAKEEDLEFLSKKREQKLRKIKFVTDKMNRRREFPNRQPKFNEYLTNRN